jgi:F0F1-type ATP synthase membrane subunit b/b'
MTTDEELFDEMMKGEGNLRKYLQDEWYLEKSLLTREEIIEKLQDEGNGAYEWENADIQYLLRIIELHEKNYKNQRQRVLEEVKKGIGELKQSIKRWALTGNIDQDNIAREHVLIYISEFESFLNGGKNG